MRVAQLKCQVNQYYGLRLSYSCWALKANYPKALHVSLLSVIYILFTILAAFFPHYSFTPASVLGQKKRPHQTAEDGLAAIKAAVIATATHNCRTPLLRLQIALAGCIIPHLSGKRKTKSVKGNPKCKTKRKPGIQHSSKFEIKERCDAMAALCSDSHLIQVNFKFNFQTHCLAVNYDWAAAGMDPPTSCPKPALLSTAWWFDCDSNCWSLE